MNNISIESLKKFSYDPKTVEAIIKIHVRREHAKYMREEVDGWQKPIFEDMSPVFLNPSLEESALRGHLNKVIKSHDKMWMASDEDFNTYLARVQQAQRDNGYAHLGDRCPALIAERRVTDAERDLKELGYKAFGIEPIYDLELGKQFLDMLMSTLGRSLPLYDIVEGSEPLTGEPLYQVIGKDNDYVGEWHKSHRYAQQELENLNAS